MFYLPGAIYLYEETDLADIHGAGVRDDIDGKGFRVGIVVSRFNSEICTALLNACVDQLKASNVQEQDIQVLSVPGALDIPMVMHELALKGNCDGLVALGCIIRGETYHFEIVANESARACTDIQIGTGIPLANAILTTENEEQAKDRMIIKGREAALVIIEMIDTLKTLHAE